MPYDLLIFLEKLRVRVLGHLIIMADDRIKTALLAIDPWDKLIDQQVWYKDAEYWL